jgi:hypothetical protein
MFALVYDPGVTDVDGRSALTSARGVTAPEVPFGLATTRFALSDVPVIVKVPDEVIGVLPTVNHAGTLNPTEVTVPDAAFTQAEPFH